MSFEHLRELEKVFEHDHDARILLSIDLTTHAFGRPARYREIARTIVERAGVYIGDGSFNRSVERMVVAGLVVKYGIGTPHPTYQVTPLGAERVALLNCILDAVAARRDDQVDGHDPATPV